MFSLQISQDGFSVVGVNTAGRGRVGQFLWDAWERWVWSSVIHAQYTSMMSRICERNSSNLNLGDTEGHKVQIIESAPYGMVGSSTRGEYGGGTGENKVKTHCWVATDDELDWAPHSSVVVGIGKLTTPSTVGRSDPTDPPPGLEL